LLPCAFAEARPFAFNPPSGFCPSLRVQAGELNFFFFFFVIFFDGLRSAIQALPPQLLQLTILRKDRKRPQALILLCLLRERDVNVLVVTPVTRTPPPPLTAVSARCEPTLVDDVLDTLATRQAGCCIRTQLVGEFPRRPTVAPLALAHVLVNVDGVNPAILIGVVVRPASFCLMRSIPNPSIAPLISTGPSTIYLVTKDDTALHQLSH
jgi:hypothetical protein